MFEPFGTFRRRLSAVLLLSAGLCASAAAAEPVKLRYQQAFAPSATDAPLFVAAAKGYFKDEGLEVDFQRSADPSNAVALVGAGEAQLGMSYPPDILIASEKGLPIKSVYAWLQTSPFGIVSLEDGANIQTPKDMIGKRIGLTSLSIDQMLFDAMIAKAGIKRSQIEIFNPGFSGGDLVGQHKLDGASGVPWYEVDALKQLGMKPHLMLYGKFGAPDFPFTSLIVNADYAKAHPDVIRGYLRAVRKAVEFTKAHPDEAVDIMVAKYPSLNADKQKVAIRTVAPLRESETTAKHGLGYFSMPQMQGLADFLLERGGLKTKVKASDVFTNDYL